MPKRALEIFTPLPSKAMTPQSYSAPLLLAVGLTLCLSLGLGCGSPADTPPEAASTSSQDLEALPAGDVPPLVLVISIDTLRASRIGAYGYHRPTTPQIDAFAAGAHLFRRASSTSSWTKPAMASLFLGRPVHEHLSIFSLQKTTPILVDGSLQKAIGSKRDKVKALARGMSVPHEMEPFHAALRGWNRGAFLNNPHLAAAFGFDRSWEHFQEYEPKVGRYLQGPPPEGHGRAPEIHRDALAFLDANPEGPNYLWIHHNDVHWPYGPTAETAEFFADDEIPVDQLLYLGRRAHNRLTEKAQTDEASQRLLSRLYDSGLRTFDSELGRFFEALKERGLFEQAAILVTSDHGEEFWEHGGFGHGRNLFSESSAIPMILKLPGQRRGSVIETPVSVLDIAPTVLSLAGHRDPDLTGVSLTTLLEAQAGQDRPMLSELVRDGYELTWTEGQLRLRVVYSESSILEHMNAGGTYELEPDEVELYDLEADPGEQQPLEAHEEIKAAMQARLEQELDGFVNYSLRLRREVEAGRAEAYELPLEQDRRVHERLKQQLEALGYI